jgi:ABC-type multidrug transport system permease subunit
MKISNKSKLSKVQSIIVFTILVSVAMSGIMSFGLLLTRTGWQPDFIKTWFLKYFLVELWLSIPTGFIVVPLIKKAIDSITRE